ncbi:Transducin/WD40 repeat-like superfamily protein [Rhynchospora pubera]|uniref:Transducin/WD40 repeat-like superfamily protein n=1 Tax=Rhynchospora pubera TaxID=906938 RepID=A0AAV8G3E5_9POAL|nr:Transducin/WD40 repeat-like superfamily protein [Rhynchospora pubera]
MISALSWVRKGAAKYVPEVAEPPSKEEIEELVNTDSVDKSGESEDEEQMDVDTEKGDADADAAVSQALAAAKALNNDQEGDQSSAFVQNISDGLRELDMDHYDDEDGGIDIFGKGVDLYYPSNDMDPYLKENTEENADDEEEEIEDMTIKPTDAVILCARVEDEVNLLEPCSLCALQLCIFEEAEDGDSNMYVHHDIILSAFPLSMAWLDCRPQSGEKGNFVATGTMGPAIEIWDLDLIDEVQPLLALGGKKRVKGKEKKIKEKFKKGSHRDAVLGLAWNKELRNVLASASADKTVKIWDVVQEKCVVTLEHHTDKVQTVAWSRHSPELLLSGSFDKSVALMDMKSSSESGRWSVDADVESIAWDPHNEHAFVVSLENGMVQCFDKRSASSDTVFGAKTIFTLHAHEKAVSSLSFSSVAPNFLATGSTDKMIKLWDLSNNQPACIASQNPKAGKIFTISFSEDSPFLLAIGGHKGKLQVWDTLSDQGVVNRFGIYGNRN